MRRNWGGFALGVRDWENCGLGGRGEWRLSWACDGSLWHWQWGWALGRRGGWVGPECESGDARAGDPGGGGGGESVAGWRAADGEGKSHTTIPQRHGETGMTYVSLAGAFAELGNARMDRHPKNCSRSRGSRGLTICLSIRTNTDLALPALQSRWMAAAMRSSRWGR